MITQILDLSKKLIAIQSTTDHPEELQKVLEAAEETVGSGFTVERFVDKAVPSLLIHNQKPGTRQFKIILNAHLDVVPGNKEQYTPYEKEGRLYGRGAYDMKVASAAEIIAFKNCAKDLSYPIALQLVTDEEIGGRNGTKYQIDQGVRADFTIAGESTELGIKNTAKGIIWAQIKTQGTAAHAAYLWQGKNAIWKMQKTLQEIAKKYPEPTHETIQTTINVAIIHSDNNTFNKVPADCTAGLDIRYIAQDKETIVEDIKKLLPKEGELIITTVEPPQFTPENNPYVQLVQKVTRQITGNNCPFVMKHGASDIRHFNRVGCDGIEFGPIGHGIHTDDEWVDINSVEAYYKILISFLKSV